MTVLLLCLAFGLGFALGAATLRWRSGPTVVVTGNAPVSASAPAQELVELNTATVAELERLPGIGPALAQRIVDYRTEHGPFSYCYELTDVPGIGSETYEGLRDLIRVIP